MNLYVGNLSSATSEGRIRRAFERYGKVGKISLNSQPRQSSKYHFCFLEMPFDYQASIAMRELSGKVIDGQVVTVRESALTP